MNALVTRDAVLGALTAHIGAQNGVHVELLAAEVAGIFRTNATARQIRQMVVELRRDGHHICGEPTTGYFLAATPEELDRCCEFLYERAMTTLMQISAMKRVAVPDLRGQLRMPLERAQEKAA